VNSLQLEKPGDACRPSSSFSLLVRPAFLASSHSQRRRAAKSGVADASTLPPCWSKGQLKAVERVDDVSALAAAADRRQRMTRRQMEDCWFSASFLPALPSFSAVMSRRAFSSPILAAQLRAPRTADVSASPGPARAGATTTPRATQAVWRKRVGRSRDRKGFLLEAFRPLWRRKCRVSNGL